ncbi:MAG: response regulator transcription factor [Ignavibacteria bacterium]|nr:response regulator transcription factor [Ignavibacteria bacterium]
MADLVQKPVKSKTKIRIAIIEDNRLLRDGITVMLNEHADLKVVAALGEVENSMSNIFSKKPDIILIDLGLRSRNSLDVVKMIKKKSREMKIIVMDLLPLQTDILDFVKAGVSGFILKEASVQEFLKTIRLVADGDKVLPPHMAGSLFTQIIERVANGHQEKTLLRAVRMTKRERQVIELIADGLTNKEIGHILHLSPYTVKSHVHNILEKMALHTRVQIAKYAHDREEFKDLEDSVSLIDD